MVNTTKSRLNCTSFQSLINSLIPSICITLVLVELESIPETLGVRRKIIHYSQGTHIHTPFTSWWQFIVANLISHIFVEVEGM